MNKIFVSSNKNPDLDGYACMIGYAEFLNQSGKNAEAILFGEVDDEANYVLNLAHVKPLGKYKGEIDSELAIVDTTNLDTLGKEIDEKLLVEIIDHRRVNDAYRYPWAKVQNELIGSCATLITEKFMQNDFTPTKDTSYLLYGAIVSNTINFKNRITTERDKKAAEFLRNKIELPPNFVEEMFKARTNISGENLRRYLYKDFVQTTLAGELFTVFQMEIVETDEVIVNRLDEIKEIITEVVAGKDLDFYFLNMIDTLKAYNYIIAINQTSIDLLGKVLNVRFENGVAKTDYTIMRKELMGMIKDYLDGTNG